MCQQTQRIQLHLSHASFHSRPPGYVPLEQSEDGSVKQEHSTAAALNTLQNGDKGALAKLKLDHPPNTEVGKVLSIEIVALEHEATDQWLLNTLPTEMLFHHQPLPSM